MGQQQQTMTGSALRRLVLALLVAALMAAMLVAQASPAFAAGKGIGVPKGGQGGSGDDGGVSVSTNPGNFVNDEHGDLNNDVSDLRSFLKRDGRIGPGVGNN